MLYPILQVWDSVVLESDLTIVGSDQLFTESMGRLFQERAGRRPQVIITTRITPGLDGVHKQSKTLGNFVAIDDDARTMFGKGMSLPDASIRDWFEATFSRREFPEDAPATRTAPGEWRALDLLAIAVPGQSRSELRRLITAGAFSVDGSVVASPEQRIELRPGAELRIKAGKRRFIRLIADS